MSDANIRHFQGRMKEASRRLGVKLTTVTKKAALDIHADVVKRTPEDTGRAQSNWQVGVGEIDATVNIEGTVDNNNFDRQKSKIQAIDGRLKAQPIYITNNLP